MKRLKYELRMLVAVWIMQLLMWILPRSTFKNNYTYFLTANVKNLDYDTTDDV